ncbi:MAG: GNAT family N-acetyltransferase [Leptolyngbyaceae cyanobacterium MO_188.B28]|nr:GNAT family N-acetyltransferase [Leptolyngbyaceae cyanobacterium MO_188.B28]
MITIALAESVEEIQNCYPVMFQLRPHLQAEDFVDRVRRQQQAGFQLAYLTDSDSVKSVAGFRLAENLGWGNYLYLDDLSTDEASRSKGYGQQLLDWLVVYGKAHGCGMLHLDSSVIRHGAHKFYLNQGMKIAGYHFMMEI